MRPAADITRRCRRGPRDDEWLTHDSIIGTRFRKRVVEHVDGEVIPEVTGQAFRVGSSSFELSEGDPLGQGFSLR
jgi:proline racemase